MKYIDPDMEKDSSERKKRVFIDDKFENSKEIEDVVFECINCSG
jgi:hypothetical protein